VRSPLGFLFDIVPNNFCLFSIMASAPAVPGVPRNPDQLVGDFRAAVEGGNAKSALELVIIMCNRNVPREKIEGLVEHLGANTPKNQILREVVTSSDPKQSAQHYLLQGRVLPGGSRKNRRHQKKNRKTQRRKSRKSRQNRRH